MCKKCSKILFFLSKRSKETKVKKSETLAVKTKNNLARVNRFDDKITLDNILQVEEVLTCVKIISETVASMPISVMRERGGNIKVDVKHPLSKLLRRKVNPYTTAYQFKQWLVVDYLLANFGCAIITRDKNGIINGLWQQNAKTATAVRDEDTKYELYYDVALESVGNVRFHYKDVLAVVNFNHAGMLGNSIVELAQTTLQTSSATTKYAQEFFKQGVAPDGFIEWSDAITGDVNLEAIAREELKNDLQAKYSGTGKFHQALLLPKGAKWVQVQSDLQKIQAVETRKFNRQVMASMFRVVPFLMGEGGTGSADQWQSFVKNLLPILKNFENSLTTSLFTEDEQDKGYYIKFNADALERGNLTVRFNAYATALNNGIMTVNEVRKREDLPLVEGGDELRQNTAIQTLEHSKNAGGTNENTQNERDLRNGKA